MRVLVFGDSITQGYWDTDGGWVERLREHYDSLQVKDLEGRDEATIFNLGISADNSTNILKRIESETISRTRHDDLPVVIIQIGINDSSSDDMSSKSVRLPIKKFRDNLHSIISKIQPLSSKLIFIGSSACDETKTTPVSWGEFYYTNESIQKYEHALQEIATEQKIAFIPVFDKFFEQLKQGQDYLPDGLHPNNEGHAFMFSLIFKELDPLL